MKPRRAWAIIEEGELLDGPYKVGFADGCAFICDLMQAERKHG